MENLIPPSSYSDPTTSAEDKLAQFDAIPLFMKSLPSELGGTSSSTTTTKSTTKEGETNPSDTLAALQALAYEGDPTEIAQGFKEQGNDLFKRKKFRDAMGFYTRALDEVGKQLDERDRRTLFSNRAACNLELSNFGACLRDCSQVFQQQPPELSLTDQKVTLKSLLRSARALLGLEKLPEALDALERVRTLELELNKQESVVVDQDVGKPFRELVESKIRLKKSKELEKLEKERRFKQMNESLLKAFKMRGIVLNPKPTIKKPLFHHCPTDVTPPHFDIDSLPPTSSPSIPYHAPLQQQSSSSSTTSTAPYIPWVSPPPTCPLVFPIFLLLPLALPTPTRDLCLEFDERSTFSDLLESMDHSSQSLDLYFSTFRGKVLKIGGKLTLGKVLQLASSSKPQEGGEGEVDGWELKEGWALEVVGIPKGDERGQEWIKEWKQEVKNGTKAIL